jgi:hypothetical protein
MFSNHAPNHARQPTRRERRGCNPTPPRAGGFGHLARAMSSIPPDIYERVHELAVAIVNASDAGDDALNDSLCQTLRAYYEEQASLGRSHPFLTEAMADYAEDAAEAVRLYQLSLEQAPMFPDEPTHTKMISLAERFIKLGRTEQVEAYLRDGRAEAVRRGDPYWIEDADRLLPQLGA